MPAKQKNEPESFGARLRRLRTAKGFTQTELADAVGTSQPLIAHYERRDGVPGPVLLLKISEALGTSAEELLGIEKGRRRAAPESPDNLRLWRKLRQVEKLSAAERKQVLQLIDALVERSALKRERTS